MPQPPVPNIDALTTILSIRGEYFLLFLSRILIRLWYQRRRLPALLRELKILLVSAAAGSC